MRDATEFQTRQQGQKKRRESAYSIGLCVLALGQDTGDSGHGYLGVTNPKGEIDGDGDNDTTRKEGKIK